MALDPTEFAAAMNTYLAANNLSIAHRRGLASAVPATLRQGEAYYATDTKTLLIGNGDTTATTAGLAAYPVGSIYISVGSTSPATLFGGTWSVFGAGKVLVGIDSSDADFDTVEETRGAKTVTLDTTMIPAHEHTSTLDGGILALDGPGAFADGYAVRYKGSATYDLSGSTGGGLAHNNIQPSIVVRMWKRVS